MVFGLIRNVWPTDLTREHHVRQRNVNLWFLFQDIQSVPSVLGGEHLVQGEPVEGAQTFSYSFDWVGLVISSIFETGLANQFFLEL